MHLTIKQSHGGSSSQARSVIDGLEADVVTLAMWTDIEAIAKAGLIKPDWSGRLPNGSLPYFSTIVFVVRKGNPQDRSATGPTGSSRRAGDHASPQDLGQRQVEFSGGLGKRGPTRRLRRRGDRFVTKLYQHVPVLDSGARGATTTFAQKGIGDVHLTWENEAHFEVAESGGELEIVYPQISIRAEPCVAVVDSNVDRRKTREAAEAYLQFLYTPEAQEIIAQNFYRPKQAGSLAQVLRASFRRSSCSRSSRSPAVGKKPSAKFFATARVFDQIYRRSRK